MHDYVTDPLWWLTAIAAGLVGSVLAVYANRILDRGFTRFSIKRREKLQRNQVQRLERLAVLRVDPVAVQRLHYEFASHVLYGIEFLLLAIGLIGMFPHVVDMTKPPVGVVSVVYRGVIGLALLVCFLRSFRNFESAFSLLALARDATVLSASLPPVGLGTWLLQLGLAAPEKPVGSGKLPDACAVCLVTRH